VDAGCIALAVPGETVSALPVIHFQPAVDSRSDGPRYKVPLYKTTARAGVLSTTGHSTNFVVHLALPMAAGSTPDVWTLQGVAAVCALNQ